MILRRETNIYDDEAIKNSIASVEKKFSATYGTCETANSTKAKVVVLEDFELFKGAQISVHFTYNNTASAPTLNVNGTGAKAIWARGAAIAATYYWSANSTHTFTYDGTHWVLENAESQEEVFNRLTNNDTNSGLYIENGSLYLKADYIRSGKISADYIYGGKLTLGGANNVSGTLEIKNASGTVIGKWDKDGLIATSGGKITSKDGKVYFDLDNSVICANKMVSAAANNNYNITVEFGTTTWPQSVSNYQGFRIYRTLDPSSGVYILPVNTGGTFITSTGSLSLYASSAGSIELHGREFRIYAENSNRPSSEFAQISSDTANKRVNIYDNLRVSGNINYSGSLGSSDETLKTNIKSVEDSIVAALEEIEIKQFAWKRDERKEKHIGVIAQDIVKSFDRYKVQNTGIVSCDENELYSVDYTAFILGRLISIERKIAELEKLKQVIHIA